MDASIGLTHFTSAAIVVYVTQKLKSAKWFPLVAEGKVAATRAFSIITAIAVSIGINYTWTGTASGDHTLTLFIPKLSAIAIGIWHAANQYAMQETLYQVTVNKQPAPPTVPAVPSPAP